MTYLVVADSYEKSRDYRRISVTLRSEKLRFRVLALPLWPLFSEQPLALDKQKGRESLASPLHFDSRLLFVISE
jgi:hypothetical protein